MVNLGFVYSNVLYMKKKKRFSPGHDGFYFSTLVIQYEAIMFKETDEIIKSLGNLDSINLLRPQNCFSELFCQIILSIEVPIVSLLIICDIGMLNFKE